MNKLFNCIIKNYAISRVIDVFVWVVNLLLSVVLSVFVLFGLKGLGLAVRFRDWVYFFDSVYEVRSWYDCGFVVLGARCVD